MPAHELPIREWVAIFYPTTGAVRLCPSVDFAKQSISASSFNKHLYKSPNDFRQRHDHATLENCWRLLHKHVSWQFPKTAIGSIDSYSDVPPDTGTEDFCNLFWDFIQDVGDRLQAPQVKTDREKDHYELVIGKMTALVNDLEVFKLTYNKQARTVFKALLDTGKQFLTEEEIKKLIYGLVAQRQLKTKQEPWIIFQYYRPQFIKDGYVVRGRRS